MAAMMQNILRRTIFSSSPKLATSLGPSAVAGHGGGGAKLWKKLSLFVAFPSIILCMVNVYLQHQEEHAHHHKRMEFIPYEHLRIRNKRFPWGDGNHTLFHNPRLNALPEGYETDDD